MFLPYGQRQRPKGVGVGVGESGICLVLLYCTEIILKRFGNTKWIVEVL